MTKAESKNESGPVIVRRDETVSEALGGLDKVVKGKPTDAELVKGVLRTLFAKPDGGVSQGIQPEDQIRAYDMGLRLAGHPRAGNLSKAIGVATNLAVRALHQAIDGRPGPDKSAEQPQLPRRRLRLP